MKIETRTEPKQKDYTALLFEILGSFIQISIVLYAILFTLFYLGSKSTGDFNSEIDFVLKYFTSHIYILLILIIIVYLFDNHIQIITKRKCLVCGDKNYPDKMKHLNPNEKNFGMEPADGFGRYVCKRHQKPYEKIIPVFNTWEEQNKWNKENNCNEFD